MRKMVQNQLLLIALLQLILSSSCLAQTVDEDTDDERVDGRFLLDLSYTNTNSYEGSFDILAPGFTWLMRSDLRVGMSASYMSVDFNPELKPGVEPTSSGLGDTIFFIQYDWDERLTASPWVPDDLGISLSILAPTGDAEQFLSQDTWAASFSFGWPVVTESMWLFNPTIAYSFSFNEGPRAVNEHAVEIGLGIVKLFPSKFWIGYTPVLWYDFNDKSVNYDDHFTMGKMFSNGMGIGLDYGQIARHSRFSKLDTSFLLNFYYQFGK